MIYHRHLREAITTILHYLHPEMRYSKKAVELLMLTAAVESRGGCYLKQLGTGPARGIFQVEPATEIDCYLNYLGYKRKAPMKAKIDDLRSELGRYDLALNIPYQIAIARLVYWRKPGLIPDIKSYRGKLTQASVKGLAEYWKKHYNTWKGKGTVAKAVKAYYEYAV